MSGLNVTRLDSPLRRDHAPEKPAPARASATRRAPRPARAPAKAPAAPSGAPAAVSEALSGPAGRLPDPPALNEALEGFSSRLPSSLRQSLADMTTALRARSGERSQKGLSEQEVLAVAIWALGSASDPDAVEQFAVRLAEFRARRFAAEAEALRAS